MTDKFTGAVLRCDGKIKESHKAAVWMLRGVSHVETVQVGSGDALLVAFDRDVRDDDFREGIGRALKAFKFVRKIEPIIGHAFSSDLHDQVKSLVDFALDMKPKAPAGNSLEDVADHLVRIRSWVRVRDAVHEATERLLAPHMRG